jgi:hypothetical protein
MTLPELKAIVTAHATSSLGYSQIELTHWHFFTNATICLVKGMTPPPSPRAYTFCMIIEPDGMIQDDDLPEYKYWGAIRSGKVTWER